MVDAPALYVGRLRHRRFRPRPHAFTYTLFLVLLNIDRIDDAMRVSPFTSLNRFNWASFDDRDHLQDPGGQSRGATPGSDSRDPSCLRGRIRRSAADAGIALSNGPIYLLTHLRYLGYNFNPISFFYCYSTSGSLDAVLAEVNNTFGDQCTYWHRVDRAQPSSSTCRWRVPKAMHVSPFMPMSLDYEFIVTEPGASLVAHMNTIERATPVPRTETGATPANADQPNFDATLTLERRPWTAAALHGALARHPWMTAKVVGAIHWEAVRLWWKGLPFYTNPGLPPRRSTDDDVIEPRPANTA